MHTHKPQKLLTAEKQKDFNFIKQINCEAP